MADREQQIISSSTEAVRRGRAGSVGDGGVESGTAAETGCGDAGLENGAAGRGYTTMAARQRRDRRRRMARPGGAERRRRDQRWTEQTFDIYRPGPFNPGWCYQPGLKVFLGGHWNCRQPFSPGSWSGPGLKAWKFWQPVSVIGKAWDFDFV